MKQSTLKRFARWLFIRTHYRELGDCERYCGAPGYIHKERQIGIHIAMELLGFWQ
jgi:hypothetical protein